MKKLITYVLAVLLIININCSKVYAIKNEIHFNKSQIVTANKYAERFCSAKADNFFKGLDNEKTLKFSYFRYIGLQSKEINSKDMYEPFIHQIRERCLISNSEEKEIKEFFFDNN